MSLYNCKTEIDRDGATHYRITKFTADLEVESSYRTSASECECPGFQRRQRCRHTEMLPRFLAREATNGPAFYDYDTHRWLRAEAEPELEQGLPTEPSSLPELPDGVKVIALDGTSPHDLYNTIAEAIGEPQLAPPPPRPLRRL